MSEIVFADSYFYLALLNRRDRRHAEVREWAEASTGRAVTTEAVLMEVGDAFCSPGQREVTVRLVQELRSDSSVEIIGLSSDLLGRAWAHFASRPDKDWGVTDCLSFAVMRDRGLKTALTGDRHFEQAGFQIMFPE